MAKYQFGDVFVEAMNRERDRRQRQEEFKQTLGFQQRQLNLLEAFKWAGLKQEEERYKSEDELKRQKEIGGMLQSGFLPAEEGFIEGRQNLITGKFDTHEQTVELFGKKFAYPKEKVKSYEKSELVPMLGGLMETKYEIDPATGEKRVKDYGTLFRAEKSGGGVKEKPKTFPKLDNKYELDAFLRLKNLPKDPFEGMTEKQKTLTKLLDEGSEEESNSDNDFAVIANKLLSSKNFEWLTKYIKGMKGYPSSGQLANGLYEAYQRGQISEEDGEEFENFLTYYSQIEENFKKPEISQPLRIKK